MNLNIKSLLAVGVIAGFGAAANATVLLDEPFTYSNGELTTASGGLWVSHSGSAATMTVASDQLSINDAGSGKDYNRTFSSVVTTGTIYASFDLTVLSSDQPSSASTGGYFAHFGRHDAGVVDGTSFFAKVGVYRPAGSTAGKYTLDFGAATGDPTVVWGTELTQNTTYQIVISYDMVTHVARLWVDPTSELSTSISDTGGAPVDLDAFMFRVSSTSDGDKNIDNLKVATTFAQATGIPEPASLALIAVGGLVMLKRRHQA